MVDRASIVIATFLFGSAAIQAPESRRRQHAAQRRKSLIRPMRWSGLPPASAKGGNSAKKKCQRRGRGARVDLRCGRRSGYQGLRDEIVIVLTADPIDLERRLPGEEVRCIVGGNRKVVTQAGIAGQGRSVGWSRI